MVLLKLRARLILGIFLGQIPLVNFDNPVVASPKFNQDIIPLIAYSEELDVAEKARLDTSLEMVNEMDNSQLKVILLNDLALNYAKLNYQEKAEAILSQSLSIAKNFEDVTLKVTTITNIAKYYAQIGQKSQAMEILDHTIEMVSMVEDKSLQGQLLLEISLKYGEMGQEESAQTLFAQSQTLIAEASQPMPEFPFKEQPLDFRLGFTGNVNSFRDTTAFVGIDIDLYKQWSEDDIWIDGTAYIDYDSSRSVNNYRPGSLIFSAYRHHFNDKWNFFTDFFTSTNQNLFSSKNDDEDLTIISSVYFGAGLNLWRGDSPRDFLDLQIGIGPRYEYDYVDFEQRRNQTSPILAIILLGRGFSIGQVTVNETFAILPALDNFDNYVLTSDTKVSIPLNQKWSLTNRLFIRYRNELVFEGNPKWQFLFSTGLEYEF